MRLEHEVEVARAVFLLRQVCGSLSEAHACKLIHRDIKPQNIMICLRGGDADIVKVLDFGLVKDTSEEVTKAMTLTSAFAGTPLYMFPERIRDPFNVDARCDIYALGAVAFRLLTGHNVYEGGSSLDIMSQANNNRPPRPSDLAEQSIPPEFDDLIQRSLSSILEFTRALNAIPLTTSWGQLEAQRWWASNPRQSSQLAAVAPTPDEETLPRVLQTWV